MLWVRGAVVLPQAVRVSATPIPQKIFFQDLITIFSKDFGNERGRFFGTEEAYQKFSLSCHELPPGMEVVFNFGILSAWKISPNTQGAIPN